MENNNSGRLLHFDHAPERVVSLVPSITESLFDLGFGQAVVGITDYCIHPAASLAGLPRLGGPRDPRVEQIIALHPELVIASWEENRRQDVEALEGAGIDVWVLFPHTVSGVLEMLFTLARLFRNQAAIARVQTLELTVEWAIAAVAELRLRSYFCPIWYDEDTADGFPVPWWMTFNQNTYCNDLLHLVGGLNVFADRERRYPLRADLGLETAKDIEGDTRYPRVTVEEILNAQPEIILLPDEPFTFEARHRLQIETLLADTPAVRNGNVISLDGSLITWPGTRMARALRDLPNLLAGTA